jgi:hypothetical protein
VAANAHQWGAFDPTTGKVDVHDEPQPGDEDLLDRAALDTFTNRGTVYVVEPAQMPDKSPIAAVFRY